ncbi:Short-chain dehydrogenase TIC 32, chloroplastic [Apostasia shenzhenica]|uniref:Short-chain dehydrogenase TIC 32, chloroplastic n=1 Tax=Apostasia shenzhenica TaxID=1088818 RepID=A0A2H9ZXL2_9ASPA|nr:Short-chain dehydrogenase TIC 32, chloroplastic [Apostasia shenzhenica]
MWPFSRKGPSGFSSSSTAEEVTDGIDGSGLTAILTGAAFPLPFRGASSGIGAETARVLALRGVHVVMAVRNLSAGNFVKEAIFKSIPKAKVDVLELDLSSKASVRKFASEFTSMKLPLNVLMDYGISILTFSRWNGATVCNKPHSEVSKTQISKRTWIENLLYAIILKTYWYCNFFAYGQSKLGNILHINELSKHLKGAATTCYLALNQQVGGVTGKYFNNCNLAEPSPKASDGDLAKKLWDFSMNVIAE